MDSTRKKQANPSVIYETVNFKNLNEIDEPDRDLPSLMKSKESEGRTAFALRRSQSPSAVPEDRHTAETARDAILEAVAHGEPSPLTWDWHVAGCLSIEHQGEDGGNAWTQGWRFMRYLKTHQRMRGPMGEWVSAEQAFGEVEAAFKRIGATWEEHLIMNRDDAEAMFLDGWEKIAVVPGLHPLDAAWIALAGDQVVFKPGTLKRESMAYRSFLGVAYHLHRMLNGGPIILPTRGRLPQLLEVQPMTVSRFRQWAVEEGILTEVREANKNEKRAAWFMLNAERWREVTA